MNTIRTLAAGAALLFGLLAGHAATDDQGQPLWPSQQGATPGYPGVFADTGKDSKAKYPKWGHPELLNYSGSVEHYRTMSIKYLPAINPFNATTLVKNQLAVELPGTVESQTATFAEPIYYMPMYGTAKRTEHKRAAVPVRLWNKTAPLEWKLGKLPSGMYAVRVVAAIASEDCAPSPKPLVITCRINSGSQGKPEQWTRRHRAVDQFYAIGEWYFHVWDDREITVQWSLEDETGVALMVHNVDVHDVLAGCHQEATKPRSTLYDISQREALRDLYNKATKSRDQAYLKQLKTRWHGRAPTAVGPWQGDKRTTAEQQKRDHALWHAFPPVNLQSNKGYGSYDAAKVDVKTHGRWIAGSSRWHRGWDEPFRLTNDALKLEYSAADLANAKPLPAPYPHGDRGWGVHIPELGGYHAPIANAVTHRRRAYIGRLAGVDGHEGPAQLPLAYHLRNDRQAARDGAFMLCRVAYALPAIFNFRSEIQQVVCRPDQCWNREPVLRRTHTRYPKVRLFGLIHAYDMLFDFIKGNEELAAAVGRYIPGIRSSDDLQHFLDTRLLHFPAREIINHRIGNDHGTPTMAITIATAIGHREASRPVMDYLFSRTWDYPLPLSSITDYMSSTISRDGTTSIGSYFYTQNGSPLLQVVDAISKYMKAGGDPKYNLADPKRFPKPLFGAYFQLEGRVAGMWPLGVGDVGGPQRRYINQGWFKGQEQAVRIGWRHLRDPKLAYILQHYFGRLEESDAEWAAIVKAASGQRNPWMANRSRVLSTWAGILESGIEHDDYRFRRAATIRVGDGWGHAHADTLDLQLHALGAIMAGDGGQRPGYGHPNCQTTFNHNLVDIDGDGGSRKANWQGHAWIRWQADVPGARSMHAKAIPPSNKAHVQSANRTVALIDVSEGIWPKQMPSNLTLGADTTYDQDIVLPQSYVFDVYRVSGGNTHTYCFHGASEDDFDVNARNPRRVPLAANAAKGDSDAHFLRRFALSEFQGAGDAPETVVGTWRLGREPFEFELNKKTHHGRNTYKSPAPEQMMYGTNYDPRSPRKYTRLHLLEQEGARLLWGRWVSASTSSPHAQHFTCLYSQRKGQQLESAYSAVIEPYAGEPFVDSVTPLAVAKNEKDAERAVAVRVVTTSGREDFCFADGRPEQTRLVNVPALGDVTVAGQFAFVAASNGQVSQATLVGGRALTVPGQLSITPEQPGYNGTITSIDHLNRQMEVDTVLPEHLLDGQFFEVGNAQHETSLEVSKVKANGAGTRVHFRKGLELLTTRVTAVDANTGVVTGKLASVMMGLEEDNGLKRGMTDGLWASNEKMDKWWRCRYLGGTRQTGFRYQLSGPPVTANDFPAGSGIRIWELGVGDQIRVASHVSWRRDPLHPKRWELTSNVPCKLSFRQHLAPKGLMVSSDRTDWQPLAATKDGTLWTVNLDAKTLGDGHLHLRAKRTDEAIAKN